MAVLIDQPLFHLCREEEWSQDLARQFPDYETYRKWGIGVALLKNGQLLSGASSYSRYAAGIEIEIDTRMEYRSQGFAPCAEQS